MAEQGQMTRAQKAAWDIYVARVNNLVGRQLYLFENGVSQTLTIATPSDGEIAIIQKAMDNAQREMVHLALGPIVRACDTIDNSGLKSEIMLASIRAEIEHTYNELHALKNRIGE